MLQASEAQWNGPNDYPSIGWLVTAVRIGGDSTVINSLSVYADCAKPPTI